MALHNKTSLQTSPVQSLNGDLHPMAIFTVPSPLKSFQNRLEHSLHNVQPVRTSPEHLDHVYSFNIKLAVSFNALITSKALTVTTCFFFKYTVLQDLQHYDRAQSLTGSRRNYSHIIIQLAKTVMTQMLLWQHRPDNDTSKMIIRT